MLVNPGEKYLHKIKDDIISTVSITSDLGEQVVVYKYTNGVGRVIYCAMLLRDFVEQYDFLGEDKPE